MQTADTPLKLQGRLLHVRPCQHVQVGLGVSSGSCTPPPAPQPGMGDCDQFGAQCRMWECPDYFQVDGAYVIKWSDQAGLLCIYSGSTCS